jgi:hypothetical protein
VRAAQALVQLLDEAGLPPRAALWTYTSDSDSWRLWVVPPTELKDKREFYLRLADVFAAHASEVAGLDMGEVQFIEAKHPVIQGLGRIFHAEGNGEIRFTNNMLNGYFLPDAIIIRMAV